MERTVSPIQTLQNGSIEYYAVYRVTHPASVSAFLGLAHANVQRRSGYTADFAHHWFITSSDTTIITVRGSRNVLSFLGEYIHSHTQYLSGVEVVYHGWGRKTFEAIVDDLYARRLSLREGVSR
jgi:hypothetical protein